jgi:hypothetical protein
MSMISGVVARMASSRCFNRLPKFIGAGAEVFLLDHVQHGIGRGDPQRVAGIGAAKTARIGRIHQLGRR